MQGFSVAVMVAVVLVCICINESTAVPFTEVRPEEVENVPSTVGELQQHDGKSLDWSEHLRVKRQSHLSLCRYCCKCCRNKGCGFCCRF
ncbi:hypothetical protein DPEC_G00351010 [Dallia pectoralis]|uniref:Uncharacterized protein n=1 Tax=Dallia pectoralis TaxID=75939 RepID=A0ACC2F1W7_DALPE|nr:hypothetical protein DPEC_G00351010 [Dallia pectoralis]